MRRTALESHCWTVINVNHLIARSRSLLSTVVAAAVVAVPTSGTLLAAPGASQVLPPVGTAAWRADGRDLPDPVRADPVDVRRFLVAAGPATRHELVADHAGVLGNLDGAPVALRYEANRRTMRATGAPYAGRSRRILLFDPRGDGRIARVFGDLTTADRIAVLVPGAGNRVDNFWSGVGGEPERSPVVQAARLHRAVDDPAFAVIAWLGYDTPGGIDQATVREDLARAGAIALNRFVEGLNSIRPTATIALLGHSYGSTVIGLAAPELPRRVTDIAVFGSPGMGVETVAGLATTARVWAGESDRDWIGWVPGVRLLGLGHGTKPADPAFGARSFATADVTAHDQYLARGTDSFASLVTIAASGTDGGAER